MEHRPEARFTGLITGLTLILTLGLAPPLVAQPNSLEVTSLEDSGPGTLRQAITDANDATGADEITFASGLSGVITLASPLPVIDDDLTITGPGREVLTVDADGVGRVLEIDFGGVTASVSGLTLRGGDVVPAAADGGGIRIGGDSALTLVAVAVVDNFADDGGGICVCGTDGRPATLEVSRSLFADNEATDLGGAILNREETNVVVIRDSSFVDNSAESAGGAIRSSGNLVIKGSTVASNEAVFGGGGLQLAMSGSPSVEIANSTISGNLGGGVTVGSRGGLVDPSVTLSNVTISSNEASAEFPGIGIVKNTSSAIALTFANIMVVDNEDDCAGISDEPITGSHNLDSDDTCGFDAAGDLPGTDPLLAGLADNGGPTETRALIPGSPAIDAGDDATCEATDQRGIGRPQDGDDDGTAVCDIGAFERSPGDPACSEDDTTLCLNGDRFRVTMEWTDFEGVTRDAKAIPFEDQSGIFYFLERENAEVLVKVLNGCPTGSEHFWVFASAATTVGYEIVVTDTATGDSRPYTNEAGSPAVAVIDVEAFETTCP